MNLNHVHLGTKNLQASRAFYERYFGFQKKYHHGDGVFLSNSAGFLIAIDPVDELPNFPAWYHLGFCLNSEAEAFELYKSMKAGNENIVREMKHSSGEYASFYVHDPDGNKIEISWHNET